MKKAKSNIRYFTNLRGKTMQVKIIGEMDKNGYYRVKRLKDGQKTLIHFAWLSETKPTKK